MTEETKPSLKDQLEEAKKLLRDIAETAAEYVDESEEYLSDSNFDSSFALAKSHANLKLLIDKAKKI